MWQSLRLMTVDISVGSGASRGNYVQLDDYTSTPKGPILT